ncbi:adenylate/guanylate cyclase domain-containing protein [Phenylobacterium sp.]|uniref:adenylate/guanylate cyclase domain-containing protein n=1 Tax=Phenylobacterium sp. TaxID=1871053 RepID=UPI00271EDFD9|nr:adenylate/guanylate cyclase domain-containing protein [Phenylobacterium sp.]MDO8802549.1 adenylate/guanylate cyclase domain-containing protein [Phenylobacterium sp.]
MPDDKSVTLGNDGIYLDAAVLYADLADSTDMVNSMGAVYAAEVYKTFLTCAARIINREGGTITAYDGDRIMAVFIGDSKNSDAARTALRINWAVSEIIRPAWAAQYTSSLYSLRHVVGVDISRLLVAKTGVRGANDLVWVGRAANYAAKMCALDDVHSSYITSAAYNQLNDASKFHTVEGVKNNMWTLQRETIKGEPVYASNYLWRDTG